MYACGCTGLVAAKIKGLYALFKIEDFIVIVTSSSRIKTLLKIQLLIMSLMLALALFAI